MQTDRLTSMGLVASVVALSLFPFFVLLLFEREGAALGLLEGEREGC